MAKRTCIRLDVPLKVKSEIEMVPEVWVISWGEVCLTSHKWFRICSDITQMVQNLWIKNQRFILPLESFYLSKSTVSPIITLLKCQSTWICSHWIVYSSNYWEGDNNQEYIEHASRWSHLRCISCKVKFSYSESVLSLLGKTQQSSLWSSQANSQYLARVTHMMLTWCATAALKESFQTFPDLLIRRYSWDDHRNSCKSTCCSCRMPFHMHSLMSLDGLLRCQLQQPILSVPVLARKKFSSNGY